MTKPKEKKLWGLFSKRYLLWVIENFGGKKEILSTNCRGKPKVEGDYVFNYGKAGDLLKKMEEE